jgi:8-oxo-dGTP diphosphatase
MGIEADFSIVGTDPLFVTVTPILGIHGGHVDISLWYLIRGDRTQHYDLDPREFEGGRWWDIDRFGTPVSDPHFVRFVTKLEAVLQPRAAW